MMTQHSLTIQATDRPELLERVLRVTRHRGFAVKQLSMASQPQGGKITIDVTVESQRPVDALYQQLAKLWDVSGVEVLSQEQQIRA